MIFPKFQIRTFATFCAFILLVQVEAQAQDELIGTPEISVGVNMTWESPLKIQLEIFLNAMSEQIAKQKSTNNDEKAGVIYYKAVATMGLFNRRTAGVSQVLADNDIDHMIGGSRSQTISVHPEDAKRARALLATWSDQQDAGLNILSKK